MMAQGVETATAQVSRTGIAADLMQKSRELLARVDRIQDAPVRHVTTPVDSGGTAMLTRPTLDSHPDQTTRVPPSPRLLLAALPPAHTDLHHATEGLAYTQIVQFVRELEEARENRSRWSAELVLLRGQLALLETERVEWHQERHALLTQVKLLGYIFLVRFRVPACTRIIPRHPPPPHASSSLDRRFESGMQP